jgi:peptide chain release factor 2
LKLVVSQWEDLTQEVNDNLDLAQEAQKEDDQLIEKELTKELEQLNKKFEKLEFLVLFSEEYDPNDAILAIHAGTGGVEAQDWTEMLLRMYLRYCKQKNFTPKIIDQTQGHEAGIKSVTIEILGTYVYGNLKSEAGVHRLVRISPFDAEKMRHTSFALVEVMPILAEADQIEIKEKDLKIETMKATGPGGQGVNTTDSAVRITHLPSGLTVKCQNERSQLQNKKTAFKLLQAKLVQLQAAAKGKELAQIRGEILAAEWGNQIRSYVLQPYKMVKDHRTKYETKDPQAVLDGDLDGFIESYLRYISKKS